MFLSNELEILKTFFSKDTAVQVVDFEKAIFEVVGITISTSDDTKVDDFFDTMNNILTKREIGLVTLHVIKSWHIIDLSVGNHVEKFARVKQVINKFIASDETHKRYFWILSRFIVLPIFLLYLIFVCVKSELYYIDKSYFFISSLSVEFEAAVWSIWCFFSISYFIVIVVTFLLHLVVLFVYNSIQSIIFSINAIPNKWFCCSLILKHIIFYASIVSVGLLLTFPFSKIFNFEKSFYIEHKNEYCNVFDGGESYIIASNPSVPYDLYWTNKGVLYQKPNEKPFLLRKLTESEIKSIKNNCKNHNTK